MMKKLSALSFLLAICTLGPIPVYAACVTNIPVEDSSSSVHNMGSQSDTNAFCVFEAALLGATGAQLDGVIGAATAPINGLAVLGVYKSATPTLTNGQSFALSLDASGWLKTNVETSVLPTGASTAANQATEITALGLINTTLGTPMQASGGSVTANAGTNLNTSALALETGGNLATLAGGVTSSVYQTNMKQVNGVTTLTGAGATGTGAQRVTASQDTTTIAGSAPGTAGSASANVVTVQGVASMTPVQVSQATASNLNATVVGTGTFTVQNQVNTGNSNTQMHICGSYAKVHITSATDTQLVAVSGSQTVYICDIEFSAAAANTFYLEKSTSSTCGTLTQIGILWTVASNEFKTAANAYYRGFNTGASASLCVDTSTSGGLDVGVFYDQY